MRRSRGGEFSVLAQDNPAVLAHTLTWDDRQLVVLHNFAASPVSVPVDLGRAHAECELSELLTGTSLRTDAAGRATVQLDGYGFTWLRVVPEGERLQY